jgi:hypothetical protein
MSDIQMLESGACVRCLGPHAPECESYFCDICREEARLEVEADGEEFYDGHEAGCEYHAIPAPGGRGKE